MFCLPISFSSINNYLDLTWLLYTTNVNVTHTQRGWWWWCWFLFTTWYRSGWCLGEDDDYWTWVLFIFPISRSFCLIYSQLIYRERVLIFVFKGGKRENKNIFIFNWTQIQLFFIGFFLFLEISFFFYYFCTQREIIDVNYHFSFSPSQILFTNIHNSISKYFYYYFLTLDLRKIDCLIFDNLKMKSTSKLIFALHKIVNCQLFIWMSFLYIRECYGLVTYFQWWETHNTTSLHEKVLTFSKAREDIRRIFTVFSNWKKNYTRNEKSFFVHCLCIGKNSYIPWDYQ